jgi:nucleoside-diphosphate-sugar epimerase
VNENVLITGSNGFIGQACIKVFEQHKVSNLVLLNRTFKQNIKYLQILSDLGSISDITINTDVNVAIHLAGLAHKPNLSLDEFRAINTVATLNLAKVLAGKGLKRFIFVSSIGVNGLSTIAPFNEQSVPSPHSDHALSKYEAEEGLKILAHELDFELVIVRPTLVYGYDAPGNFGALIKLVTKLPILPFGSANNSRSYISVDNLADFLFVCARHPKAAGETFLISDGQDVSTRELVNSIAKGIGKRLYQIPIPVNIMMYFARLLGKGKQIQQLLGDLQVDSSKAHELLEWGPPESMAQAMNKLRN